MKKTYKKPEILFESFSMSTNIAGDCESIVGNPTRGTCGVLGNEPGIDNLFFATMTGVDGCQFEAEDSTNNTFCYHIPEGGPNWFNS